GAEKAGDAVKNAAAGVVEKAGDVVNKVGDAVNKATDGGAEKAGDAVKNAAAGVVEKAGDVVNKVGDAVNKATDGGAEKAADAVKNAAAGAVEKAADATDFPVQGALQSRESLLENQKTLFKDYDLDKLLHHIRTVLEHNNLKNVQKQFHQLFDKQDSSVYSCAFESALGDESLFAVKQEVVEHSLKDGTKSVADVESHHATVRSHDHLKETDENLKEIHKDAKQTEDNLQEAHKLLEKTYGAIEHIEPQQGKDTSSLSSKELYKKGYNALLAANYVDAEKAFCAFQQRYQKDPLRDDALFWLAEALLGQKRYHEAAQVYLNVWYADKKKAYTSEILLKLARSMVALEPNKESCAFFAKKSKHSKTLESIFCKPLKRSEVIHGVH
uniref:hypothetical protein n=1 Tax=Bartonella sp. MM73XJBT TaxID=3019095 RepID=UPI00235DFAFB